ncbi:nuclear transport factor 2 family protein [Brucella intermedia]|uniref:nuclear transport factor 2 family protein n=1 Tax=Brucella intermedia TaxID=94625 RepID=UPI00224A5F99|nr:nuclear transport factor 2 family protein [Brucella intermedia]
MNKPFDRHKLELAQHLNAMLIEYWHDVDTNEGRNAASYYTEDAVFEGSRSTYRGRDQIAAFYQWRVDRGVRRAAHTVSNFRIEIVSATEVRCSWYLMLYAADGEGILPTHPPILVALITDECVLERDGQWRYRFRKFTPWFQGGAATTNPDEKDLKA